MISYNQVKVLECTRTGIGASTNELTAICAVTGKAFWEALSQCTNEELIAPNIVDGKVFWRITEKGEEAYLNWGKVPF